jgi:ribosomal-protein-alanine N-acetyltransferase
MPAAVYEPTVFNPLPGKRVLLRLFTLADISAEYIAWLNDPLVVRYSNQRFLTHTEASCRRYFESFANTPNLFLSIRMQTDDLAVGTMTAYVSPHHGTADIGIMVGRSSVWGSGVGQDAWETLLNWLLALPGIRKVTAGAMRGNAAMVRIMEHSGMMHEATRAEQELLDGVAQDILYFAKFRDR